MTKRDGYRSDLDGLMENRGTENDIHIVTEGHGAHLLFRMVDDEKAFRSVTLLMDEDQVRMLVDDLSKWLACGGAL